MRGTHSSGDVFKLRGNYQVPGTEATGTNGTTVRYQLPGPGTDGRRTVQGKAICSTTGTKCTMLRTRGLFRFFGYLYCTTTTECTYAVVRQEIVKRRNEGEERN